MEIIFSPSALRELNTLKRAGDIIHLKKIRLLLESIQQTPFEGIGKPEALKHQLSGCWSRRISLEHRLVYEVKKDKIVVLSIKGHY